MKGLTSIHRHLTPRIALIAVLICAATSANGLEYRLETVAEGLNYPWGLTELPDGSLLITERPGALKRVSADGAITEIGNVPEVFFAESGQSGLFDVLPEGSTSRTSTCRSSPTMTECPVRSFRPGRFSR